MIRSGIGSMAKYDALSDYLKVQRARELTLTFDEIERLVGLLPRSAERPQWWANVRDPKTTHVQRKAWGAAGYDAFLVAGARKVRFCRKL